MSSADDELAALMNQLQNTVGLVKVPSAAPGAVGTTAEAASSSAMDVDEDDDDLMAELKHLRRGPVASTTAAPVAVDPAEALLRRVTREHTILLGSGMAADRAVKQQRYDAGQMDTVERAAFESDRDMFLPQYAVVNAEFTAAADPANELSVRPASANTMEALAVVNKKETAHNSAAWRTIIAEIREMKDQIPIARTRHVWQRLLHLFPQHATYAAEYISLEIDAEEKTKANKLTAATAGAYRATVSEDPIVTRLRILEHFRVHLPLCLGSTAVATLFLDYAKAHVSDIDQFTLKDLAETAVERVGRCMDAGALWKRLIDVYAVHFARHAQYIEWTRRAYHQWLATPMADLEQAASDYGAFELSLRPQSRLRLQAELEQRFKAARMHAVDKLRLWSALDQSYLPVPFEDITDEVVPGVTGKFQPTAVSATTYFTIQSSLNAGGAAGAATPVTQWRAWCAILADEADRDRSSLAPTAHARRFAFFLQQRLCWFPDVPLCWLDLARHCVDRGFSALADDAFKRGLQAAPGNLTLSYSYADFLAVDRSDTAAGNTVFVDLARGVVSQNNVVVEGIKAQLKSGGGVLQHQYDQLQVLKGRLTAICCQWLSWSRHALRDKGTTHMRAVAHHAVAKYQQGRSAAFLAHWLRCELSVMPTLADPKVVPPLAGVPLDIVSLWLETTLVSCRTAVTRAKEWYDDVDRSATDAVTAEAMAFSSHSQRKPRATVTAVAAEALRWAIRPIAFLQATACLAVDSKTATPAQLAAEFRAYCAELPASPTASTCSSILASIGFGTELTGALRVVAPRAGHAMTSQWANDIATAVCSGAKTASSWHSPFRELIVDRAAAWACAAAASCLSHVSADSCLLHPATWTTAVQAHVHSIEHLPLAECVGADLAVRAVLMGCAVDDLLLRDTVAPLEACEPSARRGAKSPAAWTGGSALAAWLHRQDSGAYGPLSLEVGVRSADDAMLLKASFQTLVTSAHRASRESAPESWEASVDVLPPHKAHPSSLGSERLDLSRWQRMPRLPTNAAQQSALSAAASAGKGFRSGNTTNQRANDAAAATRLPSADDMVRNIGATQEFKPPSAESGDLELAKQRELEENGRSMLRAATRRWVVHAGGNGAAAAQGSAPPSQSQLDQQSSALAALVAALPSAVGTVEKFAPFVAAHVATAFDETDDDEALRLCPTTDFLVSHLKRALPMSLVTSR